MNKFSRDLVQGMKEAAEFAEGKKIGARVHVVELPDMRAIRRQQLHKRDGVQFNYSFRYRRRRTGREACLSRSQGYLNKDMFGCRVPLRCSLGRR